MQPVVVTALELVLLVEHNTILAYGPHGLAWESDQLVYDDLEALWVDGEHLRAKGLMRPGTRSSRSRSTSGLDAPRTRRDPTDECAAAISPSDQNGAPTTTQAAPLTRPRSRAAAANSRPGWRHWSMRALSVSDFCFDPMRARIPRKSSQP